MGIMRKFFECAILIRDSIAQDNNLITRFNELQEFKRCDDCFSFILFFPQNLLDYNCGSWVYFAVRWIKDKNIGVCEEWSCQGNFLQSCHSELIGVINDDAESISVLEILVESQKFINFLDLGWGYLIVVETYVLLDSLFDKEEFLWFIWYFPTDEYSSLYFF